MRTTKFRTTFLKLALAIIFSAFFYQTTGAIHIGESKSAYFHFSLIYRACTIGIFWAFLFQKEKQPFLNVFGSVLSVVAGAIIARQFGPLFEVVYGHSFTRIVILEILISTSIGAVGWYVIKKIPKK